MAMTKPKLCFDLLSSSSDIMIMSFKIKFHDDKQIPDQIHYKNNIQHKAYRLLAFHHSVNGQKSVRARVTLFHQLQAKHQIPIKKSVKNKLMTT